MEKNYKISIITVTKNSEKFLEDCILSVHNQFYKNYEHIIIDGNSTDNTVNIIKKHEEKIAYWISESDEGLYKNLDFLFGSVYKYKLMHGYNPRKIKWSFGFYTTHSVGFFIKRESQLKVGFYNLKYKNSSDYDLFYRMILKFKMKGVATEKDEIFGEFRKGGFSSKFSYLEFLKENTQIRIDNGQNIVLVYIIFLIRFIKNIRKVLKK